MAGAHHGHQSLGHCESGAEPQKFRVFPWPCQNPPARRPRAPGPQLLGHWYHLLCTCLCVCDSCTCVLCVCVFDNMCVLVDSNCVYFRRKLMFVLKNLMTVFSQIFLLAASCWPAARWAGRSLQHAVAHLAVLCLNLFPFRRLSVSLMQLYQRALTLLSIADLCGLQSSSQS